MGRQAVMMLADSVRDTDLFHATGVSIVDPFLYVEADGRTILVTSEIEAEAAAAHSRAGEVWLMSRFGTRDLQESGMSWDDVVLEVTARVAAELGIDEAVVPPAFPVEAADFLRGRGVAVRADRERFQMRRRAKDEVELRGIRAAQRATEAAMARVVEMLGAASANGAGLELDGEPLTAERVRAGVIDTLREHGCGGEPPITSPGPQGALVHQLGTGQLKPGESLIVDIFPVDDASRYHADMTRTFCFGPAPERLRHMHATVHEALRRSTEAIRAGVNGRAVWEVACDAIEAGGYRTERGVAAGESLDEDFFHGLGHGVGLEVHEAPSMGRSGDDLIAGDVVTIEPGVYRKDFGGVRLEDLAVVRDGGCEVLTDFPYDLEVIP
jgi:Xaa-Pro aminopeptidase